MASYIGRRELLAALGGAAAAWPLVARAQQPAMPVIGFSDASTPSIESRWVAAFVQRLGELGWIEGRTIAIEYRWAEGRAERAAEIAAELVRMKVDVIVAGGTANVLAAKQATSAIPIVFVASDPVGSGLVASLARPGGNVTGLSQQQTDLAGKRVEMLREILPSLRTLAILANVGAPNAVLDMRRLRRPHVRSDSILSHWRSGDRRISRPLSTDSRAARTRFMWCWTRLSSATGFALTLWRWVHGCRRCMVFGNPLKPRVLCPMEQISWTCFGAPPILPTRFCVGRSPPTSRSSSRPSSIWSST